MSVDNLKNKIKEKLKYAPPLGVTFKFDFGGDGVIAVDGKQNPATIIEGNIDADIIFTCDLSVMEAIIDGTQDPTMAFMTGKLKVKGSMRNALKLASLLED